MSASRPDDWGSSPWGGQLGRPTRPTFPRAREWGLVLSGATVLATLALTHYGHLSQVRSALLRSRPLPAHYHVLKVNAVISCSALPQAGSLATQILQPLGQEALCPSLRPTHITSSFEAGCSNQPPALRVAVELL